jgi:hypothetical protein
VNRTVLANVLHNTQADLAADFRRGVPQLTGSRQRMGFMFKHDDLTQELQLNQQQRAVYNVPPTY